MKLKDGVLVLCLLACAGCTGTGQDKMEVITVEQQALDEIRRTQTAFSVPPEMDRPAWQRARSFFDLYLPKGSGGQKTYTIVDDTRITSTGYRGAKYVFEVERRLDRRGIHYIVQCRPAARGAQPALADRNARNLARFIRDGTLERSLLDL